MKLSDDEFQKIVTDILTISKHLSDTNKLKAMTGDALSYTGTKLAAMKSLIIEVKVDAEREAKDADTEYKRIKGVAFKRLTTGDDKVSATAAGELLYAENDVVKAARDRNAKEAFWNQLKSISADVHDLIDSIKSRVIDLQGDRKDSKLK